MNGFNERTHAFIAAAYYAKLIEAFGERGKQAFIHGTQCHALQRGRRMAQRAIRDGQRLTYATYMRYGEWLPTGEWTPPAEKIAKLEHFPTNRICSSPVCVHYVPCCPWHQQFADMGMLDAGETYCFNLDNSIARGFNPEITYEVVQTMHRSDACIEIVHPSDLEDGVTYERSRENTEPFEYHCASSYWAYHRTTESIFGEAGQAVNDGVLKWFRDVYGEEMAQALLAYEKQDFDFIG